MHRYGSEEERAAKQEEPDGHEQPHMMTNLNDAQIQVQPHSTFDVEDHTHEGAKVMTSGHCDQQPTPPDDQAPSTPISADRVVAITAGNKLLSDYKDNWFMLVHPTSFPNGTGKYVHATYQWPVAWMICVCVCI